MRTYDEIIAEIKEKVGTGKHFEGQSELAKSCGLPDGTVSRYLSGARGKGLEAFLKFLEGAGMLSGGGFPVMRRMGINAPEMAVDGDLCDVEIVGVVGAGPGQFELAEPETLKILKEFIHPGLFVCRVLGDSMEPVIMDGAYVGAVPLSGPPKDGAIYIVYDDFMGAVAKRVYYGGQGKLVLKSINPNAPEMELDVSGYEHSIRGEILWVWHNLKHLT